MYVTTVQADIWFFALKYVKPRRLIPPLMVTLATLGLGYIFAEMYQPPAPEDRMWPAIPPSAATVGALVLMNLGIFLLWRFPPAWRFLNRYFINLPMKPHPLSVLGTCFSHQKLKHFACNMIVLWVIGIRCKFLPRENEDQNKTVCVC